MEDCRVCVGLSGVLLPIGNDLLVSTSKTFQATIFVASFCNLSGSQVLFHTVQTKIGKEMSRKTYNKGRKVSSGWLVDIK